MSLGKRISSLIKTGILAGSLALISPESEARNRNYSEGSSQDYSYVELTPQSNYFHKTFPVELTQRQAGGSVNVGNINIEIGGQFDYETNTLTFEYSSGGLDDQGSKLANRYHSSSLPVQRVVPRLNDSFTSAHVVKSDLVDLTRNEQTGYFFPEDQVSPLIRIENHIERRILIDAQQRGLEKLIKIGDAKIGLGSEIKPIERLYNFFTGYLEGQKEQDKQNAINSFSQEMNAKFVPWYVDSRRGISPRHMIARKVELDFQNRSFGNQPVAVYFGNIAIGEKDVAYGEIGPFAIKFNLEGDEKFKNLYGNWRFDEEDFEFYFFKDIPYAIPIYDGDPDSILKYSISRNKEGDQIVFTGLEDERFRFKVNFLDQEKLVFSENSETFSFERGSKDLEHLVGLRDKKNSPSERTMALNNWRIKSVHGTLGEDITDQIDISLLNQVISFREGSNIRIPLKDTEGVDLRFDSIGSFRGIPYIYFLGQCKLSQPGREKYYSIYFREGEKEDLVEIVDSLHKRLLGEFFTFLDDTSLIFTEYFFSKFISSHVVLEKID